MYHQLIIIFYNFWVPPVYNFTIIQNKTSLILFENQWIRDKMTNKQYYEYYEWTDRYYEWTKEYCEWTKEYCEWTKENCEWTSEYYEWVNEYYK